MDKGLAPDSAIAAAIEVRGEVSSLGQGTGTADHEMGPPIRVLFFQGIGTVGNGLVGQRGPRAGLRTGGRSHPVSIRHPRQRRTGGVIVGRDPRAAVGSRARPKASPGDHALVEGTRLLARQ